MDTTSLLIPPLAKQVQFNLNPEWKKTFSGPEWRCSILTPQGDRMPYIAHTLAIRGVCRDGELALPNGEKRKAVTCEESLLHVDARQCLNITNPDYRPIPKILGGERVIGVRLRVIAVRLNTKCLKDASLPAWYVVEETPSGILHHYVRSFTMRGYCYSKSYDIEEDGQLVKKLHIATFGDAHINPETEHAEISGRYF